MSGGLSIPESVRPWFKLAGFGVAGGVLVAVFWVVAGLSLPAVSKLRPAPSALVENGHFGQYLYALSSAKTGNKKLAQFDPTLPPDNAVVVAALKNLAEQGFGTVVPDELQPQVETINETNYVTFTLDKAKLFFELFQNSNGQVATVRFWKQDL